MKKQVKYKISLFDEVFEIMYIGLVSQCEISRTHVIILNPSKHETESKDDFDKIKNMPEHLLIDRSEVEKINESIASDVFVISENSISEYTTMSGDPIEFIYSDNK